MATTEIYINLHDGTDTIGGNANDIDPLTTTPIDLDSYDDGTDSGWTLTSNNTLTSSNAGRDTSSGGPSPEYETANGEGNFNNESGNGVWNGTLDIPADVISFSATFFLCTTFTNQDNMTIQAIGDVTVEETLIDSTGNVNGDSFTLTNIVPDGNDQVVLLVDNIGDTSTPFFAFINAVHIHTISTGADDFSIPIQTLIQHKNRQPKLGM